MIYYNENPPIGMFNKFLNDYCLQEIERFINSESMFHCREWGFVGMDKDMLAYAELSSIGLMRTTMLHMKGARVYFCASFNCEFILQSYDDAGMEDAMDGAFLSVVGSVAFHEGTYDMKLSEAFPSDGNGYPIDKDRTIALPGISVNQYLVPDLSGMEEDMEAEAGRFLKAFFPSALDEVVSVPVRTIAEEHLGMSVYVDKSISEDFTTLGMVLFKTKRLTVTDEDTDKTERTLFQRGSMIIDKDVFWNRGYGSMNYTIAHEVYHWLRHRVHVDFLDFMGGIYDPDSYQKCRKRMERQAHGFAACLIMPERAIRALYADSDVTDADSYELAVGRMARFFGASRTAVKYRLANLGLHEYRNTVAKRRRIDLPEVFDLYAGAPVFRALLDTERYRYVSHFVVKNDPRYIEGDELTEYALSHLDECTLSFKEKKVEKYDPSLPDELRRSEEFSLTADYDMRIKENKAALLKERKRLMKSFTAFLESDEMDPTFCEYIFPLIYEENMRIIERETEDLRDSMDELLAKGIKPPKEDKRIRNKYYAQYDFVEGKWINVTEPKIFENRTCIEYKAYEKLRAGKLEAPEVSRVVAIRAGYKLPLETTMMALNYAGHRLLANNIQHVGYLFLMKNCRSEYEDTLTFNTLLIQLGLEPIGTERYKTGDTQLQSSGIRHGDGKKNDASKAIKKGTNSKGNEKKQP